MNALTAKEITELNQGKRKNKGGEAKFSVNKRGRIYKPMIFVCINVRYEYRVTLSSLYNPRYKCEFIDPSFIRINRVYSS